MSYNADEAYDFTIDVVGQHTRPHLSNSITEEDLLTIDKLAVQYGEAAIVEALAGYALKDVEDAQEFPGFLSPAIKTILAQNEQLGILLYGMAQAIDGLVAKFSGNESRTKATINNSRYTASN